MTVATCGGSVYAAPMNTSIDQQLDELRARLEDAQGESASCNDNDCGCHAAPVRIQDEIEWLEDQR